ncbi:MAG: bifunctional phosphoribosylaminoimidazolecarboxamide formyltransferase/IMP cyclohydrolase [Chloroflexi bacterium]|nr:bifunctional phosphoribosylaminoimidazolecarboxamide formyltransferase/IMP cyclohydrolase [Chloroflexota bacterium]
MPELEDQVRALLSVADRNGIAPLARDLLSLDVELFATDGTREHLTAEGVDVTPVGDLTSIPSLLGGQVKTFHPAIYAGILARRDRPEELAELAQQEIGLLDLVVVNVRPFAPQVGARLLPLEDVIDMIDVGGVALLSAAARNFAGVTAVCDPARYRDVIADIRSRGIVSAELRERLAAEAFAMVAAYNAEVAAYLNHVSGVRFPEHLTLVLEKKTDLEYGENPHQRAAFYRETTHRQGSLADATQVHGPPPSFNDLLAMDAAYRIVSDFAAPAVCMTKGITPVALASRDDLCDAYRRALDGDPVATGGSIVAANRAIDAATANALLGNQYEGVVAPGFDEAALAILSRKEDLRLLRVPPAPGFGMSDYGMANLDFRRIGGGVLVETFDRLDPDRQQMQVVTQRRPTLEELTDLLFAWRAVKHVPSNAVVLARNMAIVGVGAGQTSRMSAVEIALHKAADRAKLSCMGCDAYFPFADAIQLAAERGVTAIIQPGGSSRDEMSIEVADRHHMAMVFTGRRHFRR